MYSVIIKKFIGNRIQIELFSFSMDVQQRLIKQCRIIDHPSDFFKPFARRFCFSCLNKFQNTVHKPN